MVTDNRTADELMKDIDALLEELWELPDNTEENKRRLAVIEKKLAAYR